MNTNTNISSNMAVGFNAYMGEDMTLRTNEHHQMVPPTHPYRPAYPEFTQPAQLFAAVDFSSAPAARFIPAAPAMAPAMSNGSPAKRRKTRNNTADTTITSADTAEEEKRKKNTEAARKSRAKSQNELAQARARVRYLEAAALRQQQHIRMLEERLKALPTPEEHFHAVDQMHQQMPSAGYNADNTAAAPPVVAPFHNQAYSAPIYATANQWGYEHTAPAVQNGTQSFDVVQYGAELTAPAAEDNTQYTKATASTGQNGKVLPNANKPVVHEPQFKEDFLLFNNAVDPTVIDGSLFLAEAPGAAPAVENDTFAAPAAEVGPQYNDFGPLFLAEAPEATPAVENDPFAAPAAEGGPQDNNFEPLFDDEPTAVNPTAVSGPPTNSPDVQPSNENTDSSVESDPYYTNGCLDPLMSSSASLEDILSRDIENTMTVAASPNGAYLTYDDLPEIPFVESQFEDDLNQNYPPPE